MASPHLEDGYVKIANEIMEALATIRIPGEARQVLDVIFRKTYGWNKKKDKISLSQFYKATGIKKPSIIRAIKTLSTMNLIIVSEKANRDGQEYEFNKDYHTWKPLAKKLMFTKKLTIVSNNAKNRLPKSYPQKKKEIKEIYVTFFDEFWKTYPARNGRKLYKPQTMELYFKIPEDQLDLVNKAVKNYADSKTVKDGFGIKDPNRFLKDGKGYEMWRDFIEPEETNSGKNESYIDQYKKREGLV